MSAKRSCPECDSAVKHDADETVCVSCGLVVGTDRIDRGPEWRSFSDDDTNPERTGAPLTRSRHDRGLSTEMGKATRAKGRKRRRIARMRKQHKRSKIRSKVERNQVYGFTEIRRLVSSLSLPKDTRESACVLFESAQDEDIVRGRTLEGFAAAAVYTVCRTRSVSRTVSEITDVARADEAELRAAYDAMNRELGLPTGPVDPAEYLPRFATELDLPEAAERDARELLENAKERGTGGRRPRGVAAACLYTAVKDTEHAVTQAAAAEVADVTPSTLRKTYAEF
jgi:transcription initiation factor TFIIB